MEYLIAHGPGNPRNSEGSFIKLKNNDIMYIYTHYIGDDWHDHCKAEICSIRSTDGGKSWSEPKVVVPFQGLNVMSVTVLRLQSGRILLKYGRKLEVPGYPRHPQCRPTLIFSDDECESWSEPLDVANMPTVYMVCNNDRIIQLKSGRIIIPVSHHSYCTNAAFGAGVVKFFLSDDDGATWRTACDYCYPKNYMHLGFMEPGLIELSDGRLMCWMRTRVGCQYKCFSYDQGEHWTEPIPAPEFPSQDSPLSMKRNPSDNALYAIWNDYHPTRSVRFEPGVMGRTPLVMAKSFDEGNSWVEHIALEDSPRHGFAYTAMMFDGNKLFLAYCCGGLDTCECMLQDVKIRIIDL